MAVEVWHELLDGIPFDVALGAMKGHYREESRAVFPADILARAMEVQRAEAEAYDPELERLAGELGVSVEEYFERRDEPGFIESLRRRMEITRG